MASVEIKMRVRVLDSHTEGEPTRVVVEGGPDLGKGSLAQRLEVFRDKYDGFRAGVVCEPRGSEVVVLRYERGIAYVREWHDLEP